DLRFLPLSSEQIDGFLEAHPYYAPVSLAAGTYKSLDEDLATVGQMNFMMGRPDLPDEFVTTLLDAVYENTDRLAAVHPDFAQTQLENVRGIPTPFHPSAERYCRARGVEMRQGAAPQSQWAGTGGHRAPSGAPRPVLRPTGIGPADGLATGPSQPGRCGRR